MIRFTSFLVCFTTYFVLTAQFVVYNDGMAICHVEVGCTITSEGGYTSQTNGTHGQIDNDGTFQVQGDWDNNNASNTNTFSTSSGLVEFTAGNAQDVGGTTETTFYNLTLTKTANNVTISTNATVDNILDFNSSTGGLILIGSKLLTIGNTGTSAITGYDTDEFVVTTAVGIGDGGKLRQNGIGAGNRTGDIYFPVGYSITAGSYALCYVDNTTGTADRFDVGVCNNIKQEGEFCNFSGTAITSDVAHLTWVISEATAGGSDADIYLRWYVDEEYASFDRANSRIMHYNVIDWESADGYTAATDEGGSYYSQITGANITSFSPFGVEDDAGVLPIELLEFNAELNGDLVDVRWITVTEINNDFFTVEKTQDLYSFKEVDMVDGAGNSSEIIKYQSQDNHPFEGISYYRLKQTDYDGTTSYSSLIAVNYNAADNLVNIYPNPSEGGVVNMLLDNGNEEDVLVILYNSLGEEVYSKGIAQASGQMVTLIEPKQLLAPGIYFVVGSSSQELFRKKILVR